MNNTTPAIYRLSTALICVVAVLSALPWMFMSFGKFGGFAWGLFGFELMVVLGAVMTLLVCFGRIRVDNAFPLAVLCFVGVLVVASVFGIYVDARNVVGSNHPDVQPWVMRTLMLYIALIAGLSVIATLDVYRRSSRSWGMLLRSIPFVIPFVAAAVYFQRTGFPAVTDASGEMSIVRMLLFIVGGLVLGILISVGGHFLIRSFEVALPEKNDVENA
ncbi:MAG: hypothetical protein ACX94C_02580 [Phycisphaerales bacterium]